jgi:hypothetical protein
MPNPSRKQRGRKPKQPQQQKPWTWGTAEQQALDKLKSVLSSPPILGYANFMQPFELHTDASVQGLGAVLYQEQEGHKRVIAYASRSLGRAKRNYPAHKLKFLALKWSVCEKFKDYLYGAEFVVYTENNPLTYVLSSAKLDATGHRWLAALAAFNFKVVYKPDSKNFDADSLSRLPQRPDTEPPADEIDTELVHTICSSLTASPVVETHCLSTSALDPIAEAEAGQDLSEFSLRDWRRAQSEDVVIEPWLTYVRQKRKPQRSALPDTPDHFTMMKHATWRTLQGNHGGWHEAVTASITSVTHQARNQRTAR